jgi:hypothetical protein
MTRYDENPEPGAASLQEASDAVGRANDALDGALARVEAMERAVDSSADSASEAEALRKMEDIEREIEGLRQDLASAVDFQAHNEQHWLA